MKMYNIFVPYSQYAKARDIRIVCFNILRRRDLMCTEESIRKEIARNVRKIYAESKGTKTLIECLTEYRRTL